MLSPSAIQRMFQYLAPRYDLWNRLASCYLDEYWRRTAVSFIPPGSRVLDLCTGTGELLVKMLPLLGAKGQAVGLDFASNMLTVAAQKTQVAAAIHIGVGGLSSGRCRSLAVSQRHV